MNETNITTHQNIKLSLALVVAIGVATGMVLTSTIIFLRSPAYNTVKQIQIGIEVANAISKSDIDTTSPIQASDINQYAITIKGQVAALNNNANFGPAAVSNKALGLQ